MSTPKTKLILNPNADLGQAWKVASDLRPVVAEFGGADWTGTVYPTHAIELAKQAAEDGFELIIAAGGDGTVHEIVNGLMQVPAERRPKLGVVLLGSGNDFAHAIGIKGKAHEALRQVLTGTPRRVDIGRVEDNRGRVEYFNNTAGVGFDAVVTIRSHTLPIVRGFMMYLTAVIQTIILNHDAARMQVKTDQETWDKEILMFVVGNGPREGGGFMTTPEAIIDDGIFHYAYIGKTSRAMMFRLVPEVMKGTHGNFKQVKMGQFTTMELEADRPLYIHLDGEVFSGFGTDVRGLKVEMLPGALEVLA